MEQLNLTEDQDTLFYWINERESIRIKKDSNLPKPWTTDPILQTYKFCNVHREHDKVSKWICNEWLVPNERHPNLWFAMVVARLFNWPPTLEIIGFPSNNFPEHIEHWRHSLKGIRSAGGKVFTGAYLVSTNGVKMDKIDYILDRVLLPIWTNGRAPSIEIVNYGEGIGNQLESETLQSYWNELRQFDGLGSFMAGQVVADLKFAMPLIEATDWYNWAPLGPGSIRGLNRFYGRPVDKRLSQDKGLEELIQIQQLIEQRLDMLLPVHNVQNCMCEYDKYLRVKNGEGRPRSLYPGVK